MRVNVRQLISVMRSKAEQSGVDTVVLVAQDDGIQAQTLDEAEHAFTQYPGLVVGTYRLNTRVPDLARMIREDLGSDA